MDTERIAVRNATEWDVNRKCTVSRKRIRKWDNSIESAWINKWAEISRYGRLGARLEKERKMRIYGRTRNSGRSKSLPKECTGGKERGVRWTKECDKSKGEQSDPQIQWRRIWRRNLDMNGGGKFTFVWCWDRSQKISILTSRVTQSPNPSPLREFKEETTTG